MSQDEQTERTPGVPPTPPAVRAALAHADPRDVLDDIAVVALPMVTRFRGITVREALLLRGPAGWAEFSPFVEYPPAEAARWLAAALEQACVGPPEPQRDSVPVNGTVPACSPDEVPGVVDRYDGTATFKIKVAEHGIASLPDDLARIEAVRAARPEAALRVDANGRYDTVAEAITALRRFSVHPLQYVEQPMADVEDLARVREALSADGLDVRIAADESIRRAEDPLRVAELGAADVIVVKVAPLGGVRAALDVVRASGLPAVVSSALDTSVGLAAGVGLAAALPAHPDEERIFGGPPACGLGTSALFSADVCDPPLRASGGMLCPGPVIPDPEALARLRAAPDREEWWLSRLTECWARLAAADA